MTWDDELFSVLDELEQHADALYDADREAEVADRSRAEYGSVTLASRLMAGLDEPVALDVLGAGRLTGTLRRVATGWVLLETAAAQWVVALPAVAAVAGAAARSVPEVAWSPLTRLRLGSALRRLGEAGERCVVHRVDGTRHDGVVRRVGADFVEVEVVPGRVELVAFAALAAVQSHH